MMNDEQEASQFTEDNTIGDDSIKKGVAFENAEPIATHSESLPVFQHELKDNDSHIQDDGRGEIEEDELKLIEMDELKSNDQSINDKEDRHNEENIDEDNPGDDNSSSHEIETQNHNMKRNLIKWILCLSKGLTSWGDRMWKFAMPIVLSSIYPKSLLPVAVYSGFSFLCCALFGANVGHWVDRNPRVLVVSSSLIIQNTSVAISAALMFILYMFEDGLKPASPYWPFGAWYTAILFFVSTIMGGCSAISSMASSVSVMKDWAIVIAQANQIKLESLNALLRRIDLACNIITPFAFALVIMIISAKYSIIFISAWNVISFFPEIGCLLLIYKLSPELSKKKKSLDSQGNKRENFIKILIKGWKIYHSHPLFYASISMVLLFITVLHSGGIMLSYLKSDEVKLSDITLSIFSGFGAVTGLMATWIAPKLIKSIGSVRSALVGVWSQLFILLVGCSCLAAFQILLWFGLTSWSIFLNKALLFVFIFSVALSRMGLWTYDLSETQMMQIGVAEDQRGIMNSTEHALSNVAELIILSLTIIISSPSYFFILVIISLLCVALAAIMITLWSRQSYAKSMFSITE